VGWEGGRRDGLMMLCSYRWLDYRRGGGSGMGGGKEGWFDDIVVILMG